jgi:hypothetical protein
MKILNDDAKRFIQCLPVLIGQEFNPWGPFTHSWDESAGFSRVIGKNNFWGIKKPSKSVWNGIVIEKDTHEYMPANLGERDDQALLRAIKRFGVQNAEIEDLINGKWYVRLPQQFIDWPTCEAAMLWYSDLIHRLYPDSWSNRQVPNQFFSGLMSGEYQYCTNPKYVEELEALYSVLLKNVEIGNAINENLFK